MGLSKECVKKDVIASVMWTGKRGIAIGNISLYLVKSNSYKPKSSLRSFHLIP